MKQGLGYTFVEPGQCFERSPGGVAQVLHQELHLIPVVSVDVLHGLQLAVLVICFRSSKEEVRRSDEQISLIENACQHGDD